MEQVLTGSRMATLWANMAAAPVNGFALLSHMRTVTLPSRVPTEVVDMMWGLLKAATARSGSQLPSDMRKYAPAHHAGLAFFLAEWREAGSPPDVGAFCDYLRRTKVFPEARCCRAQPLRP